MSDKVNVKIGSKEEKAWTDIRYKSKKEIDDLSRMIEINREIVKLARKKIEEEQKA